MSTDNPETKQVNFVELKLTDPDNPNRLYTNDEVYTVTQWAVNEGYKAGWKAAMDSLQPKLTDIIKQFETVQEAYAKVSDTLRRSHWQ